MNGNRDADSVSSFRVNVVTSVDALQFPPVGFQNVAKSLSADCLQIAISITLSFSEVVMC